MLAQQGFIHVVGRHTGAHNLANRLDDFCAPAVVKGHVQDERIVVFRQLDGLPDLALQRFVDALQLADVSQLHPVLVQFGQFPVDDELKARLTSDWRTVSLSEENKLILGYAETTTREAWTIDQTYVDRLKQGGLSDQTIHDTVAVTAYFNYVNRIADALGVELESE